MPLNATNATIAALIYGNIAERSCRGAAQSSNISSQCNGPAMACAIDAVPDYAPNDNFTNISAYFDKMLLLTAV
jgi:hypothetical protein